VCTFVAAVGADRRWPLVVAATRDERPGRPSESWAVRDLPGGARAAAPRDAVHGGTWIGVAQTGLLVGITNYYSPDDRFPDGSLRTRGELVSKALAAGSVRSARGALQGMDATRYNPFHLVVLEGAGGFLWRYDGRRADWHDLGPGLHVVTERDPHGRSPRAEFVRARWPFDLTPGKLREAISGHGEPAFDYPCIHVGQVYGTRSASILRLAPSLASSELYVADGAPCTSPFQDRSPLLAGLARGSGAASSA
jgi:uncharacterized protein with NRDE domain